MTKYTDMGEEKNYYKLGLIRGRRDGMITGITVGFGLLVAIVDMGLNETYYHMDLTGDGIEDLVIRREIASLDTTILYQGNKDGSYNIITPNKTQQEKIEGLVSRSFSSKI